MSKIIPHLNRVAIIALIISITTGAFGFYTASYGYNPAQTDFSANIDMGVTGINCWTLEIPTDSNIVNIPVKGRYKIIGNVEQGSNPSDVQDNENFYLEIQGQKGKNSTDNTDSLSESLQDLGIFNLTAGNTEVKMNTISQCPPDIGANSVRVNKLYFYALQPEITIEKTVSDTTQTNVKSTSSSPNENISYDLTIKNIGNYLANNVVMIDDYNQDKITILDPGTGIDDGDKITWVFSWMDPGQSSTKTIQAKINDLTENITINNLVEVTYDGAGTPLTDSAQVNVSYNTPPQNEVILTKTVSDVDETKQKSVNSNSNEEITYNLTIENAGSDIINNVVMIDDYNQDKITILDPGTGIDDGDKITWVFSWMDPGQSSTKTIQAKINDLTENITINNLVEVTYDGAGTPLTDSAQVNVSYTPPGGCIINCGGGTFKPLLILEKIPSGTIFKPGDKITYTLTATNKGNTLGKKLIITDILPDHLSYFQNGQTKTEKTMTWDNLGDIRLGKSIKVSYEVIVDQDATAGDYINKAKATITNQSEPAIAEATIAVELGQTNETLILLAKKSVDRTVANPDEILNYTIVVTNNSNATAKNVKISDVMPTGFIPINNLTEWYLGDINALENKTINYQVQIHEDVKKGQHTNTATISSDNHDDLIVTATVEIKEILVEGVEFEELPDTSGKPVISFSFIISLLSLITGLGTYFWAKRYDAI